MPCFMLRTAALIFSATTLLTAVALSLGQQVETTTITEYMFLEQRTYILSIRDERRALLIALSGSRCFAKLPVDEEMIAIRQQHQSSYGETFRIEDTHAEHAVTRLRCP
jgi:hypothetical protein